MIFQICQVYPSHYVLLTNVHVFLYVSYFLGQYRFNVSLLPLPVYLTSWP